ncbi:MAG TPA: glycosyltransferase family 39 protein [Thermoanaerobaculia bacterium]|nr:glycosyltransferase family 39 protein [Thermoanaerobaculia bacterium]
MTTTSTIRDDAGAVSVPLLASVFLVAAAIRIAVNNTIEFSRADESVYLLYTKALAAGQGYPHIVQMFLADPQMWVFPNPLRWAWLGATTLFGSISGDVSHHALATLSTFAGIAVVALTYWIARELFDPSVGGVAMMLAATSPLQLAMGRRALADEFFCMLVLASIAALLRMTSSAGRARIAWSVAWIVATTLAIATKEQFLFLYPAILLFWWLRRRNIVDLLLCAVPPFLFFAVFCLLARDVTSFFRITSIITGAMTAPYAEQYQNGPWFRLLIDSLAVAPLVTISTLAALIVIALRADTQSHVMKQLGVLVVAMFAVHALLSSQNLRYIVPVDSLARVLVAAFAVQELRTRSRVLFACVAVSAIVELKLFYEIFLVAKVYDPVTDALLRALKMLPR